MLDVVSLEGAKIGGRLRTWKVRITSYWPLLVALCLTSLGLGDSPLVILSLCSLALSCVLSFFSSSFFYLFSFFFLYIFLSALCFSA